ncbi:hypothetical protein GQ600_8718 [Phytophthora cactorum]|nr:hypothetical protein GQ600_8718 [Phytophthora cactorum]
MHSTFTPSYSVLATWWSPHSGQNWNLVAHGIKHGRRRHTHIHLLHNNYEEDEVNDADSAHREEHVLEVVLVQIVGRERLGEHDGED